MAGVTSLRLRFAPPDLAVTAGIIIIIAQHINLNGILHNSSTMMLPDL